MWPVWAEAEQLAPVDDWRVWLFMGGRGAGKTRAGAEWVRAEVAAGRARRVALVGPTLGDVREVMIEGPSGLRAVSVEDERPTYSVTRRRLLWPCGAEGFAFSAEDAESLRGPQFDAAWCDEIGAWGRYGRGGVEVWDMLMFGLRLGDAPRVAATTTPRATELVKRLALAAEAGGGGVVMTRAATAANAANLAPGFLAAMEEAYAGTSLARRELGGELVEDEDSALWTRAVIEACRVEGGAEARPVYDRIVVAVDPPASSGPKADACGIVAAGRTGRVVHVLEDASVRGLRPLDWAARAVAAARTWGAGEIVAEANQGGEMVRHMLEMAGASAREGLVVTLRHAVLGKEARARPVSGLYAKGLVRHAGVFRELEDEMCMFGSVTARSPDRMDAMVWAVSELVRGRTPVGMTVL